jgi:hypothetical protein
MFRLEPNAKLCKQVSVDDDTLRLEYLDGTIREVVNRTFPQEESREPAKISFTACDKKFRRFVKKTITEVCDESVSKEDFHNRLLSLVDHMLKAKRSAWLRLEKE